MAPAMGTGPWGPAISYWLTKQQWTQTALTAVMNEQAEDKALQGFRAPAFAVLCFGTRGIF